jgi:hypothetical protein
VLIFSVCFECLFVSRTLLLGGDSFATSLQGAFSLPRKRLTREIPEVGVAMARASATARAALLSVAAGMCVAGVVLGFAIALAISGSARSVPLFILGVIDIGFVARLVAGYRAVRRRDAALAMRGANAIDDAPDGGAHW